VTQGGKTPPEGGDDGDAYDDAGGRQMPLDRDELEGGLRFLHVLGMQGRIGNEETSLRLEALIEELAARSAIDLRSLDARRDLLRQRGRDRRGDADVQVGGSEDKYAVTDLPDIDCDARLHLCRARCCTFTFPLSFQDLDERVVRWDYEHPYRIARNDSGYCVHNDVGRRTCTVYDQRPAVCRTYDCRKDARVWLDFEKRLPAPLGADDAGDPPRPATKG
jgi:Fe-S-cluster containining protein